MNPQEAEREVERLFPGVSCDAERDETGAYVVTVVPLASELPIELRTPSTGQAREGYREAIDALTRHITRERWLGEGRTFIGVFAHKGDTLQDSQWGGRLYGQGLPAEFTAHDERGREFRLRYAGALEGRMVFVSVLRGPPDYDGKRPLLLGVAATRIARA